MRSLLYSSGAMLALALMVQPGCGSTPQTEDADIPDAPLPDGPQGDILRVEGGEEIEVPGLQAPVHVLRVEAGIPHIYAENEHDLRFVQGYLTGRDRLFFFDVARRLGQGRVSELLGDAALGTDIRSRGQGMKMLTDRLMSQLTESQMATFTAFIAGLNAYVDAATAGREPLPSEFALLRLVLGANQPSDLLESFTVRDVVAFATVITYQQGFETDEPLREQILAQLETSFEDLPEADQRRRAVIEDLWARVDPVVPGSSLPGFGTNGERPAAMRASHRSPANALPSEMLARLEVRNSATEALLRGGRGVDFGSNEWAVMGSHTEDGRALLAGDGHLPLSVPPLFQQVGLDTQIFGEPESGIRQVGMVFPGMPIMGPGINGHVAWTITYFDGDITDWYREEIQLDSSGTPQSSRFDGEWRALEVTEENYEIRDVPALGSVGRSETHARYTTFDGRWLASIEGRVPEEGETPGAGEALINMQGDWVIPGDTDGDGVIEAISFDYTGFDVGNNLTAVDAWGRARSVDEVRDASRGLVAFAQNVMAADIHGDIYYDGGYSATPCRDHLPRDAEGQWMPGADPRRLIDGTRYGAFEVRLNDEGQPDTSPDAPCMVPFDAWPQGRSPDSGYLYNANNDVAELAADGRLDNDEYYIGGPFAPGFRGAAIREGLEAVTSSRSANISAMQAIQADHRSSLGRFAAPFLLEAIAEARRLDLSADPLSDDETRLVEIYRADRDATDEVESRLRTWLDGGALASSGVATFYHPAPTDEEKANATATMIFNAWLRQFFADVFDDEGLDGFWRLDSRSLHAYALQDLIEGRGADNPRGIAAWSETTGESIFFDRTDTEPVETGHEIALRALAGAVAGLRAPSEMPGRGGFGSSDMETWLWGLRHLVVFDSFLVTFAGDTEGVDLIAGMLGITPAQHPVLPDLSDMDPRDGLPGYPRPGDFFAVDASNPPFTGPDYFYRNGPVMRMVIALGEDNISGVNILPGGQSALTDSPHFADQAGLWLGNEALPMRFTVDEVVQGATGRETFRP